MQNGSFVQTWQFRLRKLMRFFTYERCLSSTYLYPGLCATILYVCRKRCLCTIVFLSCIFFVDSSISLERFSSFLHWMKCHARQARSQKLFWEGDRHRKNVLFNLRQLINPYSPPPSQVFKASGEGLILTIPPLTTSLTQQPHSLSYYCLICRLQL
jgi:hypothetical protein